MANEKYIPFTLDEIDRLCDFISNNFLSERDYLIMEEPDIVTAWCKLYHALQEDKANE